MELPKIVHVALDTIVLSITFLRLLLCGRTFPGRWYYHLIDLLIFSLAFSGLLVVTALSYLWKYENAQNYVLGIIAIVPPFAEFFRLFSLLDLVSLALQKLCVAAVATGCMLKLLLNFLSGFSGQPLQFGIIALLVIEHLFVAAVLGWLTQRSIPGHLSRLMIKRSTTHTCIITALLALIAIPGACWRNWRLSLEGQLLLWSIWSHNQVFRGKFDQAREDPPLLDYLGHRSST